MIFIVNELTLFRPFLALTTAAVRKRLAEEDALALSNAEFDVVHKNITPSTFILQGLEIEAAQ